MGWSPGGSPSRKIENRNGRVRKAVLSLLLWSWTGTVYFFLEVIWKIAHSRPESISWTMLMLAIVLAAEETEKKGTVKVWFPNTVGVPDEFSQVESIILDIIPCHLLVEFYFRYLTWRECEAQGFTWETVETARHTWESFEKAVADA